MNFSNVNGWYFRNLNNRSPSWTSVEFLYRFLTTNRGAGPYGSPVRRDQMETGDVIQLGDSDGMFYHSLFVLDYSPPIIYVAAHSQDSLWRRLDTYNAASIRYIHIYSVRE